MESINSNINLHLDQTAIEAAKAFQLDNIEYRGKSLRLYLAGKNCDGFEYGVCFDNTEEQDLVKKFDDITLVCDKESYQFLEGSHISFVDSEVGKGFLVENPAHKKFRGKFFKKKQWIDKLQ